MLATTDNFHSNGELKIRPEIVIADEHLEGNNYARRCQGHAEGHVHNDGERKGERKRYETIKEKLLQVVATGTLNIQQWLDEEGFRFSMCIWRGNDVLQDTVGYESVG